MTPEKYTELTGIAVTDEALITAQINRTRSMLETMLGYPLCSPKNQQNLYNELGKTQLECACPNVDTDNLNDPDEVESSYRLFRYDSRDKYFHVDPFTTVYKVKLVYVKPGDGDNGITLKTFDDDEIRVNIGREGLSKYIEHCQDCFCSCDCTSCIQLAVDADWVTTMPKDLLYVWADMVTYYADCKRNIKSESVTTHSYTKFDRTIPEMEPQNLAVIKRYAGPYGSVTKVMPV